MPIASRPRRNVAFAIVAFVFVAVPAAAAAASFTMDQVKGYPFPTQLTAAATGSRIAWALNEKGLRNVWTAEGPEFAARRLTSYVVDDGQEITSLQVSADGRYVVYVRGGDHGSNQDAAVAVNAGSLPASPKVQVWSVPFAGGDPKLLGDGDEPAVSPASDRVAFVKDRQVWIAPIDASAPARQLVASRGDNGEMQWSPDGRRLAFVSDRGDHALIGVFTDDTTSILWIAPSTSRDDSPRWSPDGTRMAFVRRAGRGGAPEPALSRPQEPWALWVADASTGEGRERWRPPATPRGSLPNTQGGTNLHWAAGGRIVFLSYADGWPHLYSIAEAGGEPLLLTPGPYMAEYISLSPERRLLVFAGNAGADPDDVDRRHVVRVPVDRAQPEVMTPGAGLEWTPVVTGDGQHVAFLGATPQRPPLPMVIPAGGGEARTVAADRIPADFPAAELVVPRKVLYRSPDGMEVHAQLFERPGGPARKPAVIFVHGGPPRQMLLGWHYSDYYSNAYAMNQYLASRGFVVLSVNYRLGIGYGYDFHNPPGAGWRGAAEYQDVKAAAEWLRAQPQVDPTRVGIYGGSYGGYLTALALALDSNLFAAGVDIHGVHDWTARLVRGLFGEERYEKVPDAERAAEIAWRSSPVSAIATWRSPVLVIHGDDDRNVRFSQSVDLVRRLAAAGVPHEELVIPDDTHHFMRHANQVRVDLKTAEFLERKLVRSGRSGRADDGFGAPMSRSDTMPRITIRVVTVAALVLSALIATPSAEPRARKPPRPQPATAAAPLLDASTLSQLRYRYIGPVGNRLTSAAGVPGDTGTYYVGAASGGVWKTTDGGVNWEPLFDEQPVQSIGSLAVAPSDPNIVWAGTGEDCIRSHISLGNGIYRSTDAGKSWTHMGLERTGRIGKIAIDPRNPDVVLACALGHAYGPQPERGVFRTADGGKTWDKVLFVDENTGCSDVVLDPNNPRIAFAGMWQLEMKTWGRESGGPGSGLFVSRDGGLTWKRLTGSGLPTRTTGKVTVTVARSNPSRIYAIIETGDGVPYQGKETDRGTLWRSDDGGANWRVVSYDHAVNGRAHYYSHLAVSPVNENEVYFLTSSFAVSLNGGETLEVQPFAKSPGGDNHEIWIDPTSADRMIVANDGGASISINHGRTWTRVQLPIAQMYHATVDNEIPYNVLGNRQDGPSYRGPSNSRGSEGGPGLGGGPPMPALIPRSMWHGVEGGESGWATPDPADSNVIWSSASGSGSVGGIVVRYDERTRQGRRVEVWPESTGGWPPAELKYRFNWTMPLTISPHDPNTVYVGSQHVHKTTNGGQSWQVISPDLSSNDKSRQQMSGGLTPDNIGVEYAFAVMAIAESSRQRGLIWAGTNDGQVQLTRDGGQTWTSVTQNIPGLPPWGTVGNIEPSRHDAGTAYLTVDLHQVNDRDPFVYKTSDYGRTWKAITNGIPRGVTSYAHCIREDPVRKGLLYLGTESALYVSLDDGESWQPLQAGLPHAPVYWMVVQENFNDLVVSTYGRGFWILDDITPLQQLTPTVLGAAAHLFAPRPAYRFRAITLNYASSNDPTAGRDPAYGATIHYFLKSAPSGDVNLRILDSGGRLVRTIKGTKQVGINRVVWDLRHEPSPEIRLRTSPAYAPDVRLGPEGWRALPEGGRLTLMAAPGTYTVEMTVGEEKQTQPLVVRKDPHSGGSEADIQTQYAMLLDIRKDLETAAGMVNLVESLRSQLSALTPLVAGDAEGAPVRSAAQALETKLVEVEDGLIQRKLTGRGQDGTRWPSQLVSKLTYLASGLAGDDFPPTDQEKEVHALLKQRLATSQARLNEIRSKDLAAFNDLLKQRNIPNVVARAPAAAESR